MTKKKWLYLILIIVLVIPVLFVYDAFNGNPLSKFIATKNLEKHLEETYPTDEFTIKQPFYNFKMSGYHFDVVMIGEEEQQDYEFIMTGIVGSHVSWDGIYEANQDRSLINKLSNQASQELLSVLEEKVPEIKVVDVQLEVLKGKYDRDTNWDKNFTPEKPMYIHIMIDVDNLSREDVLEKTNMIQDKLNREHYDYDSVTINANVFDEEDAKEPNSVLYLKYAVSFSEDTNLTVKDVEAYND